MKRVLNIIWTAVMAALVLASCQQEEIVMSPEFTVTDGAGNIVLAYGQTNQYTLPIAFNAYSLASASSTETLEAEKFTVQSNCSWRIVPAEEGQDWIHPYPDNGNSRGKFIFVNERNYDQNNDRSAYFNVIINDGEKDIPVDGMIIVNQSEATDFLKVSTAAVDVLKEGAKNQRISILSNQKWEYKLTPDSDYATENLDWIVDNTVHPADQSIDTLVFTYQPNENGTIRGAILDITVKDRPEFNKQIKIVQYGADVEIEGFPVKWAVRVADNTYAGTFPSSGIMAPVSGAGQIRFDNACSKAVDVNGKTLFDVSDNCPRVTGVWPGDYCEFKASSPVSAGSLIKLVFATRVSGTGHKYWRLEYRDGQTWKIAGTPMTAADATGPDGQPAVYTHEMAADGSTNIIVSSVVKYETTTDEVVFRFICAANYQANGKGPLSAPNGGTWRLAVDSKDASDQYQPCISCVAAGSEVLTPANIEVSGVTDDIITFEGTPAEPFKFNVTSDMDFQVTSDASWLTVENGTGAAYESNEVIVTCAPSNLSTLRKATIEIKSGISKYILHVIQSAAGGELEPFISIVEGNSTVVNGMTGTFDVQVQGNVDYAVTSSVDWLSVVPKSKAMVDVTTVTISKNANLTGEVRTGQLVFSNTELNLETVLTVTQEIFTPEIKVVPVKAVPVLPYKAAAYNYTLISNVDFTVTTDASWVTLPAAAAPAGEMTVPITFAENTTSEYRTAIVEFYNAEYEYSYEYSVRQAPNGVIYADDFSWMDPCIAYYNANSGKTIGDPVGSGNPSANAPNAYTDATWLASGFWDLFNAFGYVNTNAEGKVFYPQDAYLKFGKTGVHSGLYLPAIDPAGKNLVLTFNWCSHVQGSGTVDPTEIVVEVEGDGVCGDTNEKVSTPTLSTQAKNEFKWQTYTVTLNGLTSSSKILIRHNNMTTTKAHRYHVDNIAVSEAN